MYEGPHSYYRPDGYVLLTVQRGRADPDYAEQQGLKIYEGEALDRQTTYINPETGEPIPRPAPVTPTSIPHGFDFSDFPDDAEVVVYWGEQEIDRFLIGEDAQLTLTDPGSYRIEVNSPFPHHKAEVTLEVV